VTAVTGQFLLMDGENTSNDQGLNGIGQSRKDIGPGPDCSLRSTMNSFLSRNDDDDDDGSLGCFPRVPPVSVGISRLAEKGPDRKRSCELSVNAYSLRDYPQGRLMQMDYIKWTASSMSVRISSTTIMLVCAIIVVLVLSIHFYYNYTRLWPIPGPVCACVSDLWRGYARKSPSYSRRLRKLHQRHGQVVRVGPNVISISEPEAIARIYGSRDQEKVFKVKSNTRGMD
jgi:hypothetical protein